MELSPGLAMACHKQYQRSCQFKREVVAELCDRLTLRAKVTSDPECSAM